MKNSLTLIFLLVTASVSAQLTVNTYNPPSGYSAAQLRYKKTIKIDQQNNVWVSFAGIGLGKFDNTNWTMYNTSNSGLPSDTVSAIEFDGSGNMWVGSSLGLAKYDGASWTVFNTQNSAIPSDSISCLKFSGSNLYIGTYSGYSVYNGTTFANYSTSNGLLSDSVTALEVSATGNVYIGTTSGLSVFNGSNWVNFTMSNSIINSNEILDIQEADNGNVWFVVSPSGLFYIDGSGLVKSFCQDFFHEVFACNEGVSKLTTDLNGNVLVFNSNSDVFAINDSYQQFYCNGSLFSGRVPDIAYDGYGNLWVACTNVLGGLPMLRRVNLVGYTPPYGTPTIHNTKALNVNNVSAAMLNRGDMHWDAANAKYEVPKGSNKHSVFASALWIGGLDGGGNLHMSAQTYRQTGHDYWPGPISGVSLPFDSVSSRLFDRIWSVYKYQVEDFIVNYQNGSVTNGTYNVPADFLTWPAKGNYYVTDDKAPFFDNNGDNLYDPYAGDYPLIKGDQMLFWIFNDSLATHTLSDGNKIGVEVLASAYAYNCSGAADSISVLNHSTFYNYRIINRSVHDYDSVFVGFWSDVDLGKYDDDFIGCDSSRATGFIYNGDNNDDGATGYGLNPPMQNLRVLQGTLADPGDGADNDLDGIIDEPGERTTMNHFMYYNNVNGTPNGNPLTDEDYYNIMQCIYYDGTHLTYLHVPGGAPVNFVFSGTPYGGGWTESGNFPNDRRFIMSSGPVSFNAGSEMNFDLAYVFTWDSLSPNGLTTSVARNIADLDRVKYWFDMGAFPSCEIFTTGLNGSDQVLPTLEVFPVPAVDFLSFRPVLPTSSTTFEIRDLMGRLVRTGKLTGTELYIGNLIPGHYILRVTDNATTVSRKFIKQ